jgi:hypothetical protein
VKSTRPGRQLATIALALVLSACPKKEPPTQPGSASATASSSSSSSSGSQGDTTVSNDSGSADWAAAQAIAQKTGASGVEPAYPDLPYLFNARGTRGILVHNGAVVTARGPAAAGAYLRDIGILDGKVPSPDSLLHLLFVLYAFPTVGNLPEQSAVDTLGPPDLQPRVEQKDGHAHLILNYRLPPDDGPSRGTQPMMRETLDIGPTGDATWSGEQFDWKRP